MPTAAWCRCAIRSGRRRASVTSRTDIQSRPTAKQYANGATESYTYESTTSRLKSITDAIGQTKNYIYTVDDRLSGISYNSQQRPTPSVSFAYDAYFPRLASMVDGIGTTTWQCQAPGSPGALQVAVEDGPFNNDVLSYQYDALGRVTNNNGTGETFGYDAIGRLTSHGTALGTFAIGYLGQTDQMTSRLANGLGTQWSYLNNQNDRRLVGIANSGNARSFSFTTTPMNVITQTSELIGSTPQRTWNYGYDATDRLTSAQQTNGPSYSYAYDPGSNITNLNGQTGVYDAANQQSSLGGSSNAYDANGNLTAGGNRSLQWDAEDRLTFAGYTGAARGTYYRYDGLGRRLSSKTFAGLETRYLWCGDRICQSRNASDGLINRYFVEGIVPSSAPGYVYGIDQLGSVRDQTPASPAAGSPASFDYDPYGSLIRQSATGASEYGYAGLFGNYDSGLAMANFRAYDPLSARWISRDPLREQVGINLFSYVNDSAISQTDPKGLFAFNLVAAGVGAAIGGASAGITSYIQGSSARDIAIATGLGVGAGALSGFTFGAFGTVVVGAAAGGAANTLTQVADGNEFSFLEVGLSAVAGSIGGGTAVYSRGWLDRPVREAVYAGITTAEAQALFDLIRAFKRPFVSHYMRKPLPCYDFSRY